MQSEDLRIGNYVMSAKSKIQLQILAFEYGELFVQSENGDNVNVHFDFISGIDITNLDVFLKEFQRVKEKKPYQYIIELNDGTFLDLSYDNDGIMHVNIENDGYVIYLREIKFIHELQNLYFALTGEELELKAETKP